MSNNFVLRQGDRMVFLGDSITEQQLYTNYVEAYLASRYPELKLTFFNAGWGGDTAPGGCARLDRDVLALKPDVVTICYGMNDGGYCPLNPGILDRFNAGMRELVTRLKAAGVRVVLLTPGMADVSVRPDLAAVAYNTRSLRALADAVLALAADEQLPVADLHKLMNDADAAGKAAEPGFCMMPDGFHPEPAGHLVMAYGLLQALGVPPRGDEVTVDLATRQATGTSQTAVRYVRHTRSGDVLDVQFDKLPFYVEPAARKVLPYLPFHETYNTVKLRVTGIKKEQAFIRVGTTRNASLPRSAFEQGINLFDLRGGAVMQAAATVQAYTREKDQLYFRLWRAVALNGGNTGFYAKSVHRQAVRLGPALDRARERLGGKSALTLRLVVSPAEHAGEAVDNGDFIGRWSFLGPFGKPFADDKVGGEAALTAASAAAPAGNWFAGDLDLDAISNNLTSIFGARTDSFGYALTTLDSPVDQDAELLLGSDDGFALWLNGERVGANLEISRGVQMDSDRFPVRLRKGRNVLLVKITQMGGEWGFCVRLGGLNAPVWATRTGE